MSNWLKTSIMYTTGVAQACDAGTTHELTEAKQGRYHYTMGPYSEPVLHIKPGDRVVVQTRDAFEGAITDGTRHAVEDTADALPQSAERPDHDRGRGQKGDALAVHIESMVPRGDEPRSAPAA